MNGTTLCTILQALGVRRDALITNVSTICNAVTGYDRYLPRHLRRGARHSTRRVERAVIDQWLIWRA